MRMKKAVKLILPVILLTFMWAGGIVRGDDGMGTMAVTGTQTYRVCLPPAWSLNFQHQQGSCRYLVVRPYLIGRRGLCGRNHQIRQRVPGVMLRIMPIIKR